MTEGKRVNPACEVCQGFATVVIPEPGGVPPDGSLPVHHYCEAHDPRIRPTNQQNKKNA